MSFESRPECGRTTPGRKEDRKAMWEAYAWVVAVYREAADRLRAGDRRVSFPEGTFPPGPPFIPFARGQPP